jgi:hypothetical protein
MEIKDSGSRRTFSSGAVRDCAEGKGRCDLLPLWEIGEWFDDPFLQHINQYIYTGDIKSIHLAMDTFVEKTYRCYLTSILEVSKQYEDGCKKYGERNWQKGISLHCYVDSAVRHYLKYMRGDEDEPHNRAVLWNLLGLLFTHNNFPNLHDLPFAQLKQKGKK